MKKKPLGLVIGIIAVVCLIIGGAILTYNEKEPISPEKEKTGYIGKAANYQEIGSAELKEEQNFNNIKYTQNHLSTTDAENYASFTSVIYNETGVNISHKHLAIDFFNANGELLGTMESEVDSLKPNDSTVIYGIVSLNLSDAYSFKVREV